MAISVKELLGYALESGASDLHLSVGNIPMLRIHGEMKKIKFPSLDLKSMEKIRDDILNSNQKKMLKDNLEIDFSSELKGKGRFRVNFFNQIGFNMYVSNIPASKYNIKIRQVCQTQVKMLMQW